MGEFSSPVPERAANVKFEGSKPLELAKPLDALNRIRIQTNAIEQRAEALAVERVIERSIASSDIVRGIADRRLLTSALAAGVFALGLNASEFFAQERPIETPLTPEQ